MKKPVFYLAWFLVNLIQSFGTELLDDEAYYWVYSKFIDWGYYDHPPMIGLLVKWGYALQHGELGVRLFIVLMSTATIFMMDQLLDKKDDNLFYTLAASILFLQFGGVIAVPDVPLLFFIALYFVVLKRFLSQPGLFISIALGLVVALMLYSKYHGILIVFFTLLARPQLVTKTHTWTAAGIAAILFLPHVFWQFSHGLPSVNYHLFERNAPAYKIKFSIEYVLGQILLAGPLIGWLVLYAAFRKKPVDPFTKILYFTSLGVLLLFLLTTFKGRSEANWAIPAYIGIIVLAHQWLVEKPTAQKWVYRLLLPALFFALILRVYMLIDVKPLRFFKKDEFHKNPEWAMAIKKRANGLPVVFMDSYQRASKYWFYAGDTSFSLNSVHYRRNNYNFWPIEERLQDKQVLAVHAVHAGVFQDSLYTEKQPMFTHVVDSFYSYSQIEINEIGTPKMENNILTVLVNSSLPKGRKIRFNTKLLLAVYDKKKDTLNVFPTDINIGSILDPSTAAMARVDLKAVTPGRYAYKWAVESCIPGWPTMNSTLKTLLVK